MIFLPSWLFLRSTCIKPFIKFVTFATSFDFYSIVAHVNPCEDEVWIHADPIILV